MQWQQFSSTKLNLPKTEPTKGQETKLINTAEIEVKIGNQHI